MSSPFHFNYSSIVQTFNIVPCTHETVSKATSVSSFEFQLPPGAVGNEQSSLRRIYSENLEANALRESLVSVQVRPWKCGILQGLRAQNLVSN